MGQHGIFSINASQHSPLLKMSGGFSEAASAKSSNVTHHNDTIFTRATEGCSEPLIRFLINRSSSIIVVACHVEGNHFTSETSRISHQIMREESSPVRKICLASEHSSGFLDSPPALYCICFWSPHQHPAVDMIIHSIIT